MLNNNFTTKLVSLQEIIIKNMETTEEKIEITIEMPVKTHICPHCKNESNRIYDYRIQKIKDTPAFGKKVVLIFKKRRYVAQSVVRDLQSRILSYHALSIKAKDLFGTC